MLNPLPMAVPLLGMCSSTFLNWGPNQFLPFPLHFCLEWCSFFFNILTNLHGISALNRDPATEHYFDGSTPQTKKAVCVLINFKKYLKIVIKRQAVGYNLENKSGFFLFAF